MVPFRLSEGDGPDSDYRLTPGVSTLKHDNGKLDLYLAHRSALVDYATPILGCRARAEDIVQDAYLRFSSVTEGAGTSIAHPVAYLYRTVRNLALNLIRRQITEGTSPSGSDLLETMASATPTPEHEALYRDELRAMTLALAELPERTRRAFELHRLGGYTLQQVAATLGVSVGLAHQMVRDALSHCADRLGDGA
jgi:RNA polymerase sigma factor (sigma-70 family)